MKAFLVFIVIVLLSCSKDAVEPLTINNRLGITIMLASGSVREFAAGGTKVSFGCTDKGSSILASRSYESIEIYVNRNACVTRPGTYDFSFRYSLGIFSPSYSYSSWTSKQGRFTYTAFDGKYAEGYFEAVCKSSFSTADSVVVKGTFSGYLK